jgi:hypothetical protein
LLSSDAGRIKISDSNVQITGPKEKAKKAIKTIINIRYINYCCSRK